MLIAFFDDSGVIHFEFLQGTVNCFVYCQVLGCLREAVRKWRPTMWAAPPGDSERRHQLYLHLDNAPAHNALMTQACLMECGIDLLPHPPYSPDMVPSDFFLFPRLKRELRSRHFPNLAALKVKSPVSCWTTSHLKSTKRPSWNFLIIGASVYLWEDSTSKASTN